MINIQPYANPMYFVWLVVALLPLMVGLYYGRRLQIYEAIMSAAVLVLVFGGSKWHQGVALVVYLLWQVLLVRVYGAYRQRNNATWVFVGTVLLSIIPLVLVKLTPAISGGHNSWWGFLGVSYLSFKAVQVIMELRDGTIKVMPTWDFVRFLLFFPTVSSGPIDRFRRFQHDYTQAPSRDDYLTLVGQGVHRLFLGLLYKFVLGYLCGTVLLPIVAHAALLHRGMVWGLGLSWPLVGYMYVYSMYLFFDFAGYSLFAVGVSNLMGINTPMNFNQPFRALNIKDFWNRWHMTLSFWFRDFIFMRTTFFIMKHKLVRQRVHVSQVAYLVNFLIMGFWHGVTWYYIVYGLFHAGAIIINDIWLRFKKRHRQQVPHNRWTRALAVVVMFHVVCLSFLIFFRDF